MSDSSFEEDTVGWIIVLFNFKTDTPTCDVISQSWIIRKKDEDALIWWPPQEACQNISLIDQLIESHAKPGNTWQKVNVEVVSKPYCKSNNNFNFSTKTDVQGALSDFLRVFLLLKFCLS